MPSSPRTAGSQYVLADTLDDEDTLLSYVGEASDEDQVDEQLTQRR